MSMLIDIPLDLASDVVRALESAADWYRRDKGHDPEDVARLEVDADRLDALAGEIDARRKRMEADARSAAHGKCVMSHRCVLSPGHTGDCNDDTSAI